jgi:hypothetical protein
MSIPQSAGGVIESRDDLVRHLSKGMKPKSAWRIEERLAHRHRAREIRLRPQDAQADSV